VLASHVQDDPDAAAAFCAEQKVNFPVYHQFREPAAPTRGGIPHSVIIDHEGNVLAEGHPCELIKQVDDAVAKAPDRYPMLGNLEIKHCADQAKKLLPDKPVAPVLTQLRQLATKGDAKAEEAAAMVAAIEQYLRTRREELSTLAEQQPARAFIELQSLSRVLAGLDGDQEVKELIAKLQKIPGVPQLAILIKKRDEVVAKLDKKPSRALEQQLIQIKAQLRRVGDTDQTAVGSEAKALSEAPAKD